MNTIKGTNYQIYFKEEGLIFLNDYIKNKNYSKIFVLVDTNTNEYCLPYFLSNLSTDLTIEIIEIEAGEVFKTIETCLGIWESMLELGVDRKSLMINVGGGVVTDIGGFIACTIKRGIDFINIPTTLLAMVDASVGGKNGVDIGKLKNQVGIIKEPNAVIVDDYFLSTLPQEEMRSGLAEMIKHGIIYDLEYFQKFESLNSLNEDNLLELIHKSVEIKNSIVSQDLTENGIRKALNFGHTLGHAIESYCLESDQKKSLLHGEAIAIGMILEAFISVELGLLSSDHYKKIKKLLLHYFPKVNFNQNEIDSIIELMSFDKKNEYGKVKFALISEIGKVALDKEVDHATIYSSFDDYLKN